MALLAELRLTEGAGDDLKVSVGACELDYIAEHQVRFIRIL
jgi:hypothetical protein